MAHPCAVLLLAAGRRAAAQIPRRCYVAALSADLSSLLCWPPRERRLATDVEYRDRAPTDAFFVSDAPDVTAPGRIYRRFPVGVGSRLVLSGLPRVVTSVDVRVGHLEEIAVQVLHPPSPIDSLFRRLQLPSY